MQPIIYTWVFEMLPFSLNFTVRKPGIKTGINSI